MGGDCRFPVMMVAFAVWALEPLSLLQTKVGHGMALTWFTVTAQVLNFLILLVLLRYFLFDRIMRVIAERRSAIDQQWQEAERKHQEASELSQELEQLKAEHHRQREALLAQAVEEAELQRQRLLGQAREEVRQLHDRWATAAEQEGRRLRGHLQAWAAREVLLVARSVLQDLADSDLQEQAAQRFLALLGELDDQSAEALRWSLRSESPAVVQTAQPLSDSLQSEVTRRVREVAGCDLEVEFRTAPDLLAGLVLEAGGRRIAWDLRHYLDGVEQKLDRVLAARVAARPAAGEKTSQSLSKQHASLEPTNPQNQSSSPEANRQQTHSDP